MPQMYWIIPVEGGAGNRPDNTLPGGQGGYPSQPIYHPGHPDHGLPAFPSHPIAPGGPSGGYPSQPIYHPGHPDHGLPSNPYPDQGLPEGGTDIPSNELPMPQPPQEYEDDLIVAVKKPNESEWTVKAYDPALYPDQGPQPQPHSRSRR